MDEAKSAVKGFLGKSGKHDTTVHEKVAPAVTHDTRDTHHHENVTTAVDREVHQEHYHTSVQPIQHKEVLPEQHHHNIIPVEHKHHQHGDPEQVKQKLAAESGQFTDRNIQGEHKQTSSTLPVVTGEHNHHHVHETIQPVVHKQTIEPHVVHTTVPIHEVHHNEAHHHAASALPAMSMNDFKKQGGVLSGREERQDGFEGEPRRVAGGSGIGGSHSSDTAQGGAVGSTTGVGGTGHHGASGVGSTGQHGTSGIGSNTQGTSGIGSGTHGTSGVGNTNQGSGLTGNTRDSAVGGVGQGTSGNTAATGQKPSLMSRLNPMKDADGDGKKGMMD